MKKLAAGSLVVAGSILLGPLVAFAVSFFYVDSSGNVGIGNTSPEHALDVSGSIYSRMVTASSSAINWDLGNVQTLELTSSPTLGFSNAEAGGEYTLILKQDSTGGRTVTWPGTVIWSGGEPTLTPDEDAVDLFRFVYDGSNYLGSYNLNYSTVSAVAFDYATGTVDVSGSATSVNWNHTVSGSKRALVVFVYNDDDTDKVTSVTYNGVSMTRVDAESSSGKQTVYAYLLMNPAVGTHSVVVSASSGSNQLGGVSLSYTGVKQTGQPDSFATNQAGVGGGTFTLSTTVGDADSWVIGAERNDSDVPNTTGGATNRAGVNTMKAADKGPVSAGSQSVAWTASNGAIYTGVVISLSPDN
ncbi:hypothetical protein KW798_01810 [Candidatus Parcubacteria bacterium]|nr:hypothetical protein [Candidatus Parcubacteria bacterium]